jgi:hypothetical protein
VRAAVANTQVTQPVLRAAAAPASHLYTLRHTCAHCQSSGTKWSAAIETQLCYEIKTFLLAGHETSAAMLMWSVYELGRNAQARQQVGPTLNERGLQATLCRSMLCHVALCCVCLGAVTGMLGLHDAGIMQAFMVTPRMSRNARRVLTPLTAGMHVCCWRCRWCQRQRQCLAQTARTQPLARAQMAWPSPCQVCTPGPTTLRICS